MENKMEKENKLENIEEKDIKLSEKVNYILTNETAYGTLIFPFANLKKCTLCKKDLINDSNFSMIVTCIANKIVYICIACEKCGKDEADSNWNWYRKKVEEDLIKKYKQEN